MRRLYPPAILFFVIQAIYLNNGVGFPPFDFFFEDAAYTGRAFAASIIGRFFFAFFVASASAAFGFAGGKFNPLLRVISTSHNLQIIQVELHSLFQQSL